MARSEVTEQISFMETGFKGRGFETFLFKRNEQRKRVTLTAFGDPRFAMKRNGESPSGPIIYFFIVVKIERFIKRPHTC